MFQIKKVNMLKEGKTIMISKGSKEKNPGKSSYRGLKEPKGER